MGKSYPPELLIFIRDECQGMSRKETAAAVNERFPDVNMTEAKAAAFRKNHHLPNGRDTRFYKGQECTNGLKKGEHFPGCEKSWFKKDHVPENTLPIGTVTRRHDGVQIVKVTEKGTQWERWKLVHHIIYEEHFGKIPEGMKVGFKDADHDNLDPENLFLMTNEENLEMNRQGTRSEVPQITEARLNLAKVKIAIRKRKEGNKNVR